MNLRRRGFLGALLAAPVVITTPGLLMPVKRIFIPPPFTQDGFHTGDIQLIINAMLEANIPPMEDGTYSVIVDGRVYSTWHVL